MKKGDLLQFDCKEASGSGSGNVGESKHSWSRQTQDGVTTNIDDGHASTDREDYAWNADAQLLRTETGARLSFSWQSGSAEEMGISAEHPYANWSPAKRDFLAF